MNDIIERQKMNRTVDKLKIHNVIEKQKMNKAIFLDRDGVINKICYHHDIGVYSAKNLQEFEALPEVKEAIKLLKELGFLIVVISNQPGVAMGYITEKNLAEIDHFMLDELNVDRVYNCKHHPHHTGECECRKPKDGLLQQAAQELNIDLAQSYMVGDNLSDIQTGKKCKGNLLIASERVEIYDLLRRKKVYPDIIVKNLWCASQKIKEIEEEKQDLKNIPIMIVAAGVGSRLQDITGKLPKCLVSVHDKPLIQYQIEEFVRQGFTSIIFCLGYQNTYITECFQSGDRFGADIKYSIEPFFSSDKLSGTAGAVKYGQRFIENDTFIVFYGDNITTLDFNELLHFHKKNNAFATILVRPSRPEKFSSIITLCDDGRMAHFIEKPTEEIKKQYYNITRYENNGIYIFDKRVFNYIEPNKCVDFAKDIIPKLIADEKRVFGYICKDFFKELGRTEKFKAFLEEYTDPSFMLTEHEATFRSKNS